MNDSPHLVLGQLACAGWYGSSDSALVYESRVPIFSFHGWRDVRVDPEGPERVVEVEDYEFGEGMAVGEGCGGLVVGVDYCRRWAGCWRVGRAFSDFGHGGEG